MSNPYPVALVNPYLMGSQYYSVKGWVYQRRRTWHGIIWSAIKPPISAQPGTALQNAWKDVFADAVTAWQALTEAQKDIWRAYRYPVHASGYNRFIRAYLKERYPPTIVVFTDDVLLQENSDKILQETGFDILLNWTFLLQENGDLLLQETGDRVILN